MATLKDMLKSAKKIDDNLKGIGPNDPRPIVAKKKRAVKKKGV